MTDDWDAREQAETIGYYAMFELVNGFRKAIYWSKKQMENHALKYSKGYAAKKGYTFWEKNFDGMAYKTMLRQLISKWGIMSIEMQQAFTDDMTTGETTEDRNYVETDNVIDIPVQEVAQDIVEEQPVQQETKTDVAGALFGR